MKIKGGFATALDHTENKMMEKDEDLKYALKRASFFSHHVKEKRLKFPGMKLKLKLKLEFLTAA